MELHPYFAQGDVAQANRKLGIVTQAWSPIGGVKRYWVRPGKSPHDPLKHPTIAGLARKHGKSAAQIILRWHIEHGFSAIPKSVHAERIAENFDIFDFALTREEVGAIDVLDEHARGGPDPDVVDKKRFSFVIED